MSTGDHFVISLELTFSQFQIVPDGNEPDPHFGEDHLQIVPDLQVLPSKAGEVLHHDGVDFAVPRVLHHALEGGSLEVGSGEAVVLVEIMDFKIMIPAVVAEDLCLRLDLSRGDFAFL